MRIRKSSRARLITQSGIVDRTLAGVFSEVGADEIKALKGLMRKVLMNVREEKVDESC